MTTRPPVRWLVADFITTRVITVEVVNAVVGIVLGTFLFLPDPMLMPTGVLARFPTSLGLDPDLFWAVLFSSFGLGTAASWLCKSIWCRKWGMFGGCLFYSFLLWQTLLANEGVSVTGAFSAALWIGSIMAYLRLSRMRLDGPS